MVNYEFNEGKFGRNLDFYGPRVTPRLSEDDIRRIMEFAKAPGDASYRQISNRLIGVSADALIASCRKMYKGQIRISSFKELKSCMAGTLEHDPFDFEIRPLPTIVEDFDPLETDVILFVYGSLAVAESLARTTGQDPYSIEYMPVTLANHVAKWGAPSRRLNYSDAQWRSMDEDYFLWLTIEETGNPDDVVYGALIKVNDQQFRLVRGRESHYTKKVVTHEIRKGGDSISTGRGSKYGEIVTFAPEPKKLTEPEHGARIVVRAGYYDETEKSLSRMHNVRNRLLPELPRGVERVEGHPTDDRVADDYWWELPKSSLDSHYNSFAEELMKDGVTRNISRGRGIIPFIQRGIILNRHTYDAVVDASEAAVSLMVKAHRVVLEDERLFKLNGYEETDRLLSDSTLANNYSARPLVARVDLAIRGDKIGIYEVNTDSPAGSFHLDVLMEKQWQDIEDKEFTGDLVDVLQPPSEVSVCDAIVDAFYKGWECYQERAKALGIEKTLRRIAIVDRNVKDAAAYSEFEHFKKILARKDVEVSILDLTNLRYRKDTKELTDSVGRRIDAVYKRLLWQEAIDIGYGRLNDPLCRAYLDNAVYVMNSFRSRLAGSKLNMAIAKSHRFADQCAALDPDLDLTEEETRTLREYIPETLLWGPSALDDRSPERLKKDVLDDVSDWVLKVFHRKGGEDFIDGAPSSDISPIHKFQGTWPNEEYIAQQLQEHGNVKIPVVEDPQVGVTWQRYQFILGAYVVDGKCIAIEAKTHHSIPINVNTGAQRTAVFSLRQ